MATATAPEPKTDPKADTVVSVLGEDTHPVADVMALLPPGALARAWSRGEVEFGRRAAVVVGPVEKDRVKDRRLVVEAGWNWTGAKQPTHQTFRDLWAGAQQPPPECGEYVEYREGAAEGKTPLATITRDAAVKAAALFVRLTDRGLSQLESI